MSKIVLDDIASGYDLTKVNVNFQKIEDELNNKVLYRDSPIGESNSVLVDIDVNGKALYNLPSPTLDSQAATKVYVDDKLDSIDTSVAAAAASAVNAANSAALSLSYANNASASAVAASDSAVSAASSAVSAAGSASTAALYSSLGLGAAAAFDLGSVTDAIVIFPTDWGTVV